MWLVWRQWHPLVRHYLCQCMFRQRPVVQWRTSLVGPAWSLRLFLCRFCSLQVNHCCGYSHLYYSLQVCNLPSSHKSLFCHLKKKKKRFTLYLCCQSTLHSGDRGLKTPMICPPSPLGRPPESAEDVLLSACSRASLLVHPQRGDRATG